MTCSQRFLGTAAVVNFLLGLLHVAAVFGGETAARFFTAPPAILAMIRDRSPMIYPVAVVMLALFGVFGFYAWSGGGFMRRLPLLRTGLLAVTAIYLLRGLAIAPQIVAAQRHPGVLPPQAFVFSAIALLLGLVYLAGTIGRWRQLAPAAPHPAAL